MYTFDAVMAVDFGSPHLALECHTGLLAHVSTFACKASSLGTDLHNTRLDGVLLFILLLGLLARPTAILLWPVRNIGLADITQNSAM